MELFVLESGKHEFHISLVDHRECQDIAHAGFIHGDVLFDIPSQDRAGQMIPVVIADLFHIMGGNAFDTDPGSGICLDIDFVQLILDEREQRTGYMEILDLDIDVSDQIAAQDKVKIAEVSVFHSLLDPGDLLVTDARQFTFHDPGFDHIGEGIIHGNIVRGDHHGIIRLFRGKANDHAGCVVYTPVWYIEYKDADSESQDYYCWGEIDAVNGKLIRAIFKE